MSVSAQIENGKIVETTSRQRSQKVQRRMVRRWIRMRLDFWLHR